MRLGILLGMGLARGIWWHRVLSCVFGVFLLSALGSIATRHSGQALVTICVGWFVYRGLFWLVCHRRQQP